MGDRFSIFLMPFCLTHCDALFCSTKMLAERNSTGRSAQLAPSPPKLLPGHRLWPPKALCPTTQTASTLFRLDRINVFRMFFSDFVFWKPFNSNDRTSGWNSAVRHIPGKRQTANEIRSKIQHLECFRARTERARFDDSQFDSQIRCQNKLFRICEVVQHKPIGLGTLRRLETRCPPINASILEDTSNGDVSESFSFFPEFVMHNLWITSLWRIWTCHKILVEQLCLRRISVWDSQTSGDTRARSFRTIRLAAFWPNSFH